MATGMKFSFSVLVLEDEVRWVNDKNRALKEALDHSRYTWKIAETTADAISQLSSRKFHFISIDQNLPEKKGEIILPDHGLNFLENMVRQNHASLRMVYTAYGKANYANRVGKIGKCSYFEKSITGRDDLQNNVLTPRGWATYIRDSLEADYVPFMLELAGNRLPLALAERSRRTLAAQQRDRKEEYIKLGLELWESTLDLIFAQTAALCRAAGVAMAPLNLDTPKDREDCLEATWPRLVNNGWLDPWKPFIGSGDAKGNGVGQRFLSGASRPCRELRNKLAHSFTSDQIHEWATAFGEPALFLFDALAFWIENPLLIEPRFHPQMRNHITAQAIAGDGTPFPGWEVEMPGMRDIERPAPGHVYLAWKVPGDAARLIDLHPFVTLERDSTSNRNHLMLVSRRMLSGQWMRRSLTDGISRPWRPGDEDLNILRRVFPNAGSARR